MSQKQLKKCSTSIVIREMKVKMTLRNHLTPIKMAKIKRNAQEIAYGSKDIEKGQHSSVSGGIANLYNHTGNQSGIFSENWKQYYVKKCIYTASGHITKTALPYQKDTCSPIFIAFLFIIARNWKQPRQASMEKQIQKMWFIHIVVYYSAIKTLGHYKFSRKMDGTRKYPPQ